MRFDKFALVIAGLAACACAFAQTPLGTVSNVFGAATATQGSTTVTVVPGTVFTSGTRFIAASGSSVSLTFNNGCNVTVPAGHGLTVIQGMSCPQVVAAIQPVVAVGAVPLLGAQALTPTLVVVGGLGLAAAGLAGGGSSSADAPLSAR